MLKTRKKLGDMLVESGLLTADQLQQVLSGQRRSQLRLGDYLIQQNIVPEEEIIRVLGTQLHISRYDSDKNPVTPEAAKILPRDMAMKYKVAPLGQDAFVVRIAMVDPLDIAALDAVEGHTGLEVEPLICAQSEFPLLINGIYGFHSAVSEVLREVEGEVEVGPEEQESDAVALGVLQDIAGAAPVIRLVNSILSQAVQEGASDIHISPEKNRAQVRLRIDGKLHEIPPPPRNLIPGIISRIKVLAGMDIANVRIPQDGRFNIKVDNKEINIRASTLPTIYGENLVLRLLFVSSGPLTMDNLGLSGEDHRKIMRMIKQPYGLVLSVGPTGSGKSSSLCAFLLEIMSPEINIVTLEDPVEYRLDGVRQVQLNRKAGMTFASGLRSILRQDPDVVLVGETRDAETAQITTQAALTGHLVFTTLHTNDAVSTISRLQNMGIEPFLVASSLVGIIAQRLVRRLCPQCAEPYQPAPEILEFWDLHNRAGTQFKKPVGCSLCMNSGYRGRVGIYEVLVVDGEVQEMILNHKSNAEIVSHLRGQGKLVLLKEAAADKIAAGVTSFEEAARTVLT
ncbi:GspE/PulE family protein [Desulfurivibrio alkaliphilus]|uniref:Type II secretion system protein E n=1 Tax=Desulfurivibrio alkaliphilus (strain DSM 19089 / UNIQEM U267 / AHT2) TaxID=589865 RepID=D6Z765_DESAT|nr:GspE/PulE family protein [Desulfurivibrio alkaliphilus]ADH87052.1 type II secretion system protein E [Desulfurivibrio alkaliphilus AHT 2]